MGIHGDTWNIMKWLSRLSPSLGKASNHLQTLRSTQPMSSQRLRMYLSLTDLPQGRFSGRNVMFLMFFWSNQQDQYWNSSIKQVQDYHYHVTHGLMHIFTHYGNNVSQLSSSIYDTVTNLCKSLCHMSVDCLLWNSWNHWPVACCGTPTVVPRNLRAFFLTAGALPGLLMFTVRKKTHT
jgi:sensor histidine kinase YesM